MTHTKYFVLGSLIQQFGGLIVLPLLVTNLTLSQFGKYNLFQATAGFLTLLFTLSLYQNITAYYVQWKEENILIQKIGQVYWLFLIYSLGFGILLFFTSYFWIGLIDENESLWVVFEVIFASFFAGAQILVLMYYRMNDDAKKFFYFVCFSVFWAVVLKVLYFYAYDIYDIKELYLIDVIINSIFFIIIFIFLISNKISYKSLNINFSKKSFYYAFPIFVSNLLFGLKNYLDKLLINIFFGLDLLGVYSYVQKFYSVISGMTSSLKNAFLPYIIKNYKNKDIVEQSSKKFILYSGLFAILIFLISYPVTLYITEKSEYIDSLRYLPFFVLLNIFALLYLISGTGVAINKNSKPVIKIQVIASLISLLVLIITIKSFGIYATICSSIVYYLVATLLNQREYKIFELVALPKKIIKGVFILNFILILGILYV
ncbi:lipopolysaccharide biosynthesis protein [Malaciobacter sp. WC5094]